MNAPLPGVIFLSAYIPLYNFTQPSPFVEAQQESLEALGVSVEPFYIQGIGFQKYPQAVKPFRGLIKASGADIVHAHYAYSGALALSQRKLPVVLSLMGEDLLGEPALDLKSRARALASRWLAQVVALAVQQVIVKTDQMRRNLWRKRNVHVLPNGVNLEVFRPAEKAEARRTLGLAPQKRYVLFPGSRKRSVKDYPLAEKAFRVVQDCISSVELLTLESLPRETIPLYMNAADAVLFTSQAEGSPNVIKEAMACNIPIVTVDVGDTRSVVEGTRQCWITSRDPQEIARRLAGVLESGEPSNGRERIQAYDQGKIAGRLLDIYRQTIAQSG